MANENGSPKADLDLNEFSNIPGDSIEAKIENAVKKNK